jgi:hypothetical protein
MPLAFERWRVAIGPGAERACLPAEWSDALVTIEQGTLQVEGNAGARCTFGPGDMLVLPWLQAHALRNVGTDEVVLRAVRRAAHGPVADLGDGG